MGEPSKNKRASRTEPTEGMQKTQGWIRMHSDENAKTPQVEKPQDDEPQNTASQPPDHKVRKLEKPIE